MVVSKDNKRRRKEIATPPPPAPSLSASKTAQQSAPTGTAAVESSPEMPKRTKVQAQRKFAQGQSAPQSSSYGIALNAASCSNTGPSTSSETREPPIEILPNKRPNTEDFLTFICFRGTASLPPHLDFRNEGHSREPQPTTTRKPNNKIQKPKKKGKRGRPKIVKNDASTAAITSKSETVKTEETHEKVSITDKTLPSQTASSNKIAVTSPISAEKISVANETATIIPGAVRKRAVVLPEGNRRGRRNGGGGIAKEISDSEKCNSSPEVKRRSNRATKDNRPIVEPDTDDDDEDVSLAQDEKSKDHKEPTPSTSANVKSSEKTDHKISKPSEHSERKSETPSKESETTKSTTGRRGRPPSSVNKKDEIGNATPNETANEKVKEKNPVKRVRQRESPIFIPSPESSGRMTRQRAFFEPVKVPTPQTTEMDELDESDRKSATGSIAVEESTENKKDNSMEVESTASEPKTRENTSKETKANASIYAKETKVHLENGDGNNKNKSNLNVFDFSSDDEQPLAKSIKLKKGKASPKKPTTTGNTTSCRGRKTAAKKSVEKEEQSDKDPKTESIEDTKPILEKKAEVTFKTDDAPMSDNEQETKTKVNKRGRAAKKKVVEEKPDIDEELSPPSPKKAVTARQSRKVKGKTDEQPTESRNHSPSPPARSQRPSRKTKEAAAIYMGIIGHKLQLADDEEDDLSLSSFPDIPNVKEMEKMENEIKKNASHPTTKLAEPSTSQKLRKPSPKPPPTVVAEAPSVQTTAPPPTEKPPARRGRPPKQSKAAPIPPPKREIEGMLVKKGALAKIAASVESAKAKSKSEHSKVDSEDEDFLINEELNETKRKLEKSFSDSDDEPLAIKVNVKGSDKDAVQTEIPKTVEPAPKKSIATTAPTTATITTTQQTTTTQLTMLPLTAKPTITTIPPPITAYALQHSTHGSTSTSPLNQPASSGFATLRTTPPGTGLKLAEKKSPVPTSKILNVPATYAMPGSSAATLGTLGATGLLNKTSPYLPQASPHYHNPYVRPPPTPTHAFSASTVKSPTTPATTQSPLKYQTPPTTYPPPIEAYQCPKINPNFLTPKFDRTTLPRTNNFPSPSPVKFDSARSTLSISGLLTASASLTNSTFTSVAKAIPTVNFTTTNATPSTSASAAAVQSTTPNSNADTTKEERRASLMPSKEESGKVFGIASVSLAQSSGPDNTKCTLGKCGSIHKPILGPVVPTEAYFGDQLTSKERRKAKVNMTHEQIQKWLIECSSNPDDIQDDLDDEFDDNLRPNQGSPQPPGRDDKESTSFSSSSKTTRELGKSESTWSTKGPSLKATPVVVTSNRKDDDSKDLDAHDLDFDRTHPMNLTQKSLTAAHNDVSTVATAAAAKELLPDKKTDKKSKDMKSIAKDNSAGATSSTVNTNKDNKQQQKSETQRSPNKASPVNDKQSPMTVGNGTTKAETAPTTNAKQARGKKNAVVSTPSTPSTSVSSPKTPAKSITPKRAPVYNQNAHTPKPPVEVSKPVPVQKRAVQNDSIYSFDKDDEPSTSAATPNSKPSYRRQGRNDTQQPADESAEAPSSPPATTTALNERSPSKKRAAAAAAATAVSLTLSPTENCKLVKVSLESGQRDTQQSKTNKNTRAVKKASAEPTPKTTKPANPDAESDADGATFYIPLQGTGVGGSGEGGIQGVAVKLGREGPDGPNQKVVMQATLVTKAQMDTNSKPLPDSLNTNELVKTLLNVANNTEATTSTASAGKKVTTNNTTAAGGTTSNSASNSLKNVPIGTVQPRFKAEQPSTSANATGGLVRVNSNSSLFSGSAKSRTGGPTTTAATLAAATSKKFKDDTPIKMANNTAFPRHDDPTQMVEAPIFRPTEKEFADPIEFIERITPIAARFGICKIIPPATFKPECRISDEMRFTAYNQYVHKMLHRWGPSAKELSAIKKYLATQSIVMNHPPWIGGMEVDLPRLYHTVQEQGGLKAVIENKKWARVAEEMCIPKLAQDRVTKLDDIYCKYLLPYDTLSRAERQKLFEEVEADWAKREARARRNADRFVNTESVSNEDDDASSDEDDESEEEMDTPSMECIVTGRKMPLSQFYRIARNTMALWFKNTDPTVTEVEAEFWRHVAVRDSHVCVHSGSIDSSGWGYGFPSPGPKGKGSNYARHPWNLKVLTNNAGSVLRSLGPVMGVTVPTLHVGMLFSACCWYRDPHGLSWIEYLHTGASKVWYGIPDDQSANFRKALTDIIPTHCQNKTIWLPCDTVMVPPHMLTDRKVSLCRIEQKPGEFIVVFPRAYTSSLATGYVVSESVYFATMSWLELAKDDFRDIHNSCEPAMFSLEQLLFALGYDQRVNTEILQQMLPMLNDVCEKENAAREQLRAAGVTSSEKVRNEKGNNKNAKKQQPPHKSIESECDLCRANLYISMVRTEEGNVYCLQHALKNLNNGNIQAKQCKLIYAFNVDDIQQMIKSLQDKIQQKQRPAIVGKKAK